MAYGWSDGLIHKSYIKHTTDRCSIQAMIDFGEFEEGCLKDPDTMKNILKRVEPAVLITREERIARGWKS